MNSKVSLILAVGQNNIIGIKDKMAWHSAADFSHFKNLTKNKPCIFGSTTFFGLPKYPLRDRLNIVVDLSYTTIEICDGYIKVPTIKEALSLCLTYSEVMICGGASIYKYFIDNDLADIIYLTHIEAKTLKDVNINDYVQLPFDIDSELKNKWQDVTTTQSLFQTVCVIENDIKANFRMYTKR